MSEEGVALILLALFGYLLGGIPFGVLVSKAMGLPDPRTVGSKNVGFTNVLRVSGVPAGLLTLAGDMGKGWVVGFAAPQWLQDERAVLVAAAAPFLGHVFSPYLRFHGGKGVATALGSVLGVGPLIGFVLLAVWVAAVGIWRYSSGGAIAAFALFPLLAAALRPTAPFIGFAVIVSGIVLFKHRGNIERLRRGTETKIGQSRA